MLGTYDCLSKDLARFGDSLDSRTKILLGSVDPSVEEFAHWRKPDINFGSILVKIVGDG